LSGTVSLLVGGFILATFLALFNYLTPSDPAPFQYKVTQLQASLAGAKQQVEIMKSNYEQATANVEGLAAQAAYNKKRLADIQTLAAAFRWRA
jgi:multidrug resistance efflux pump